MPNPLYAIQRERVVTELCHIFPHIDVFISAFHTPVFGDEPGRYVELTIENGPQVILNVRSASIKIPYWYGQEHLARRAFDKVCKCIAVIEDILDYETDDPQLDKIVKLPDDLDVLIHSYTSVIEMINKQLNQNIHG